MDTPAITNDYLHAIRGATARCVDRLLHELPAQLNSRINK